MCSEGQRRAVKSRKPPLRRAFWACNGTTSGSDRAAAQTDSVDGGGPRSGGGVLPVGAVRSSQSAARLGFKWMLRILKFRIVLQSCAVRHKFRLYPRIHAGPPRADPYADNGMLHIASDADAAYRCDRLRLTTTLWVAPPARSGRPAMGSPTARARPRVKNIACLRFSRTANGRLRTVAPSDALDELNSRTLTPSP